MPRRKIGLTSQSLSFVEHLAFCGQASGLRQVWSPATDVFETAEAIVIRMELAGVRPDEIHIQATESTVVVSGHRADVHRDRNERLHQMEIVSGAFERAIALPCAVRPDAAEAHDRDGLLEIVFPKGEPAQARTLSIEIHLL